MENELPVELESLFSENILKCITETKKFEDDIFIKYSEDRCQRWLKAKFDKLKTTVKSKGFGKKLYGYQLPNCSSFDSTFTECNVTLIFLVFC